ncbi:hypothetical protein RV10_GL002221 [Enterococcus pallens]|nr:hypothetical protein RV10_GL002221 [Enterococcus pallens]
MAITLDNSSFQLFKKFLIIFYPCKRSAKISRFPIACYSFML